MAHQLSLKRLFKTQQRREQEKKATISESTTWENIEEKQHLSFLAFPKNQEAKKPAVLNDDEQISNEESVGEVDGGQDDDDPDQPIHLSQKQYEVITNVMEGKSVFFTGAAGTGKSYILRVLRRVMKHVGKSKDIAFTAPTGVAACNIRGLTIHSWASIGRGNEPIDLLLSKISRNRQAKKRWEDVEILVIDEISMLSAELFDIMSKIGCRLRLNEREAFGGIQLILCGDFFQLPPVGLGSSQHFCFMSKAWKELFSTTDKADQNQLVVLDKVFRQKDSELLNILHEMRRGSVSNSTRSKLTQKVENDYHRECNRKSLIDSGRLSQLTPDQAAIASIQPTKLFGKNLDVDRENTAELRKLDGEEHTFNADDEGDERHLKQLRNGSKIPENLKLKVGAQVMLLKNLDTAMGLVNGTRGCVVAFEKQNAQNSIFPMLPVVDFVVNLGDGPETIFRKVVREDSNDIMDGAKVLASRTQLPLMLAYAITIHKSQGMTIPHLEVSFSGIFEYGQAYVALSRCTDMNGLTLKTFNPQAVKAHPHVKAFYSSLGYEGESIHNESSTVETSIAALSRKFLEHRTYGKSVIDKEQSSSEAWISSKRKAIGATGKQAVTHTTVFPSKEESQSFDASSPSSSIFDDFKYISHQNESNYWKGNMRKEKQLHQANQYPQVTVNEASTPSKPSPVPTSAGSCEFHYDTKASSGEKGLSLNSNIDRHKRVSGMNNSHGGVLAEDRFMSIQANSPTKEGTRKDTHLTKEQRERIEANKAAAQERKRAKRENTPQKDDQHDINIRHEFRSTPSSEKDKSPTDQHSRGSQITEEQRRRIEANRIAAEERMKASRKRKQEEKDNFIEYLWI